MHHSHFERMLVQPDIRSRAVAVHVQAPMADEIRLAIEGTPFTAAGEPGRLTISFPDFQYWSPASPTLYTLLATLLRDGNVLEEARISFGMRELSLHDNRFHLNNRTVFIKGVALNTGDIDEQTEDEAASLVQRAKSAGFNTIFVNGALSPLIARSASTVGMMLIAPPPTELPPLFNETSIVAWSVADLEDIAPLRAADPTRLILLQGTQPTIVRPYETAPEPLELFQVTATTPASLEVEPYLQYLGVQGRLNLIAGAPTAPLPIDVEGLGERGLDVAAFTKGAEELHAQTLRTTVDALRSNGHIAGYCIEDLHTLTPLPVALLAKAQRPLRPLIRLERTNLAAREEIHATILLANEERLEGRADLSLQIVGPTNQVLWKKRRGVKLVRDGKELWSGAIAASGSSGAHRFIARVLQAEKIIAEASVDFHVLEPITPSAMPVNLLDPRREWASRLEGLLRLDLLLAPVHIVPPIANTIRAYPDNDLMQVLAQVRGGAVALIFSPPEDWNDLAVRLDENLKGTSLPAAGDAFPVAHYARLHPVFESLPSRGLLRHPYRQVLPQKVFLEASDEDIAGSYSVTPAEGTRWNSTILMRRHGVGRVVFVHFQVLENVGKDPLADRLLINLVNHFSRRSIPADKPLHLNQPAVEWLRAERVARVHRWQLCGAFPNPGGAGHKAVYPPEQGVNVDAAYAGWFERAAWRPWFSVGEEDHHIDLHEAFATPSTDLPRGDYATYYAYAEFNADKRQEMRFLLDVHQPTKLWLNGALAGEVSDPEAVAARGLNPMAFVRQGRNTLLIKCSKGPGPAGFQLTMQPMGREPLQITWWK